MDDAAAHRETSFTLRGSASSFPAAPALPLKLIRVNRAIAFAPAARSLQTVQTVRVAPDDLVEIEFETGERLWMRGDDYRSRMARTRDRRDADRDVVDVPIAMPLVAQGLEARDTRGAADWVVKSLKVIGIDLAGLTARAIAEIVEARATEDGKRPGLGLFQCRLETGRFALTTPTIGEGDEPWLVFIHGTGSSTWGSFGELWSDARRDELSVLRAAYGDRALAFEHRTLTHSPIRNAVDLLSSLVRVMPAGAALHLVTHSRGGLIGELLCRPAITDEELDLFGPAARRDDYGALSDLRSVLTARAFRIARFVRVACPALGTTLASGRLDRWLSVIGTLAGFVPGTPLADTFAELGDFVAAVIKERTDPATLPGLEAMMPDSRCIALVNWPAATIDGSLAVIAGDIDPAKWWARLAVWLSDKFYEGDHDLVVNTPSMYGGARRSGRAVVSLHKAETVNHFTYFREQRSVERLVTALTASESAPWKGFTDLHPPAAPIARSVSRGDVARPTVFVLPGIMGSELAIGDRSIWVDLLQLARGAFADLRPGGSTIRASRPLARYYGRLCEYLSGRHNVVPFAFDWRIGIDAEADRLAAAVREIVDAAQPQNQPVRFLAHSMGGLVTRAMIARHPDLWRDACRHPDTRVVMLGTPNGGSHAIPEVLVGQSVVFRKLARVDVRHSAEELLSLIARFPGVLVMLPDSIEERWFSADTWQTLHARAGAGWVVPDAADLDAALATRRLIDGLPFDPDRMIYVAGSADVTVAAMRIEQRPGDPRERIVFQGTTRGDGRVTWDSGIPPSLPTYFMNVAHGDLAAHEPSFPAIDDLLTVGETRLLPRTPPVTRAAAVLFDMPPAEDDRYPDEDDLVAAALGAAARARREKRDPDAAVHVSVVHGNLAFARHPVAVGHYSGDTIVSAEKHLDRALQFALSRRLHLGLYPGSIETSAVFSNARLRIDPYARPAGAIVVGLGTVGSLTASSLTRSFSRALLEFVLGDANDARGRDSGPIGGVSTLLIGTGAGGMSVTDSVFALLRGAQRANQELAAAGEKARIGRLEFIELYQDRAILAVEALDRLWRRAGPETTFVLDDSLKTRDGGLLRISYDEEPEWWQRLQIQGERVGEEAAALRFASVTRRARAEVRLLPTQRRLVDEFVQRSLAGTRRDQSIGRTLFDLLLPNELKEMAPDQDNLMLLLDEEAARYPWELLDNREDRTRGPFAVEHGLLRQLEAREFREIVRATVERTALVVGDPVSPFVELKGAQDEAEAVWLVLQQGFTVTKKVRPAAHEVITALFERAYKVLHLAGHGVYRVALPGRPAPVTGMVIGDGVLLTPAEVAQMRSVPDLVFVNCCHLGRIERDTTGATVQELAFPELAANLAAEFIRMGVRCVIAAGWAVDDGAALTFATAFYREMLDGESFGDAVLRARAATYANHPGSNTWGAYQCYGDPDFRLVLRGERLRQADEEPRFLSPAHALRDLGNITARLKTRSSMGSQAEVTFLEAIVKVLAKKKWLSSGAINASLARAYGEAGEFERASEYYCAALASEDGAVTARDVEQWANLVSRLALSRAREHPDDDAVRQEAVRNVRRAITVLKGLLGGAKRDRATSERLALLGSAYKRLAWIDPDRRGDALARMAESYAIAAATARDRGGDAAYPLINARWAQLVMRWQDGRGDPDPLPDLPADLAAIRASLDAREASDGPQFWQDSMRVDCDLLEAMASGAPRPDLLDTIATRYLARLAHASARERASVSDQFDFLIAMAGRLRDVADALAAVRQKITKTAE